MKSAELCAMLQSVPDMSGKSEEGVWAMPALVYYFKCQDAIEKGEPGCTENKFSNIESRFRACKGRGKWHPGW